MSLVTARTDELSEDKLVALRTIFDAAFDDRFSEDDWLHALGGVHFFLEEDGVPIAHASVVPRRLQIQGRLFETGYVEAVSTHPSHQGQGHGSTVMRAAARHIVETYELGALATGENAFYQRLGWETWRGPTGVRTEQGTQATPRENGAIMILLTPKSRGIDVRAEITCEWRPADVW